MLHGAIIKKSCIFYKYHCHTNQNHVLNDSWLIWWHVLTELVYSIEWKDGCAWQESCVIACLRYCFGNSMDVLRKTTKNLRMLQYWNKRQNLVPQSIKQGSHIRASWKSLDQLGQKGTGYFHHLHCTFSHSWHSLQATRLTDHKQNTTRSYQMPETALVTTHAFLAPPQNVHIHTWKFRHKSKTQNLQSETLNSGLLCSALKGFLEECLNLPLNSSQ